MTQFEWRPFLEEFSRDLLADEQIRREVPASVVASTWMGFDAAREEEVVNLEERLGATLPRSYREFLLASNGWRAIGAFIWKLWPTSQVAWFRDRHLHDWIEPWIEGARSQGEFLPVTDDEYLVYGKRQRCEVMRDEYMYTALEVSDVGDAAICLLNPKIISDDGEWKHGASHLGSPVLFATGRSGN